MTVLLAGCGEEQKPTWKSFTVTAKPIEEITGYGAVVPYEFTITNGHKVPVFIERVEAKAGRRHELVSLDDRPRLMVREQGDDLVPDLIGDDRRFISKNGLLLPGQKLTIRIDYRVLAAEEKILFTFSPAREQDLAGRAYLPAAEGWSRATEESLAAYGRAEFAPIGSGHGARAVLTEAGKVEEEPILAYAKVTIDAPVAPFDPKLKPGGYDAWCWSPALNGYVIQIRAGVFRLKRMTDEEVETIPLPPLPFEFLDEVDAGKKPKVHLYAGDVREITKAGLLEFLEEILQAKRELSYSDEPEKAKYGIRKR